MICAFIAEHRARFGVVPICRVLSERGCAIAPRMFYARLSSPPSARTLWGTVITEVLAGYYEPDEHGRRKRRGPLHRLTDVELLTADWVGWYNTDRLMHRLGRIPPIEYESIHYAATTAQSAAAHQ